VNAGGGDKLAYNKRVAKKNRSRGAQSKILSHFLYNGVANRHGAKGGKHLVKKCLSSAKEGSVHCKENPQLKTTS